MYISVFCEVSLNGKLSLKRGTSSQEMMMHFEMPEKMFIHNFRGSVDAILIGRKTVSIDNPQLTNRYGVGKQPDRIIISNSLNFTLKEEIFSPNAQTIVVTNEENTSNPLVKQITSLGHKCIFLGKKKVNFPLLFTLLEKEWNYQKIMVEGGGTIISELLKHSLVNEIIILRLPIIAIDNDVPEFAEYVGSSFLVNATLVDYQKFNNFTVEKYSIKG